MCYYKKGYERIILKLLMIRYNETGGKTNRKGKFTKTFKKWLSDNDNQSLVDWIDKKEKEQEEKKN